ncbi:MAG: hypothetical protein A3I66_14880 [Burkholderiales bacterium RIFCSPLOWO2_02_FULL_57_36]|nr:MAG: hypothetical protein A3I66_14880 [Burkholderiales bacterium RIFCSPLOWO2_02_FULL_57_36]
MQVEMSEEGGVAYFPGLAKPVSIDVDSMEAGAADQLRQLIEHANFFDLPATVGTPAKGAADYRQYTLTIDDGPRKRTVRIQEPIEDPALNELVQAVRKHVKAARAAMREQLPKR